MQHQTNTDSLTEEINAMRAFVEDMWNYHQEWKSHPSYEFAFYLAALSGLGHMPRHDLYMDHAELLAHEVIDTYGYKEGSLEYELIHECLHVAHLAALEGRLMDDEQFTALIALEESGDVLALIRGEVEPNDFF